MEIQIDSTLYRIEEWSTTNPETEEGDVLDNYTSLQGRVYGHFMFADGTFMTTAPLYSVSKEGVALTINGLRYKLGSVDKDFEVVCPNAKERLIENWS